MRERKSRSRSATTTSLTCNMVPQQQTSNGSRAESPTNSNGQPVFGSLMVDRKSSTPYSDATQVGIFCWCVLLMKFLSVSVCVCAFFAVSCVWFYGSLCVTCLAIVRGRKISIFLLSSNSFSDSVCRTCLHFSPSLRVLCVCISEIFRRAKTLSHSFAKVMFSPLLLSSSPATCLVLSCEIPWNRSENKGTGENIRFVTDLKLFLFRWSRVVFVKKK